MWGFAGDRVYFMRCWGFRATCFWPLYFWIDGWGFGIWLNVGLLVVNFFVTYMYFVYTHVYGYNDWLPYLGCGLLT